MRGTFEILVLLAIDHLKDGAFGLKIYSWLHTEIGKPNQIGQVYLTLKRLRKADFIEPAKDAGGQKIVYRLTQAGRHSLDETLSNILRVYHAAKTKR